MKTVTTAFTTAQKRQETFPIYRVEYKRRYWDTGTNAYIYESSWTELSRSEIKFIEPIIHQFDTQTQSEFKVSNVIMHFKNDLQEWKEGSHSKSKFKSDGVSSFGYEPYLMKFRVKAGFSNIGGGDIRAGTSFPGGSDELIVIFTGLAVFYQYDTVSESVKVTVEGMERLLLNGEASNVKTTVTLETIGTGDGFTKEYITSNSGVGEITTVTVNAVTMTKGTDYQVSQLNDMNDGALIILAKPAPATQLVKCTYDYWKKNQTVDQLISDLITEAGITSSSIANATLGTQSQNITHGDHANFNAGTTKTALDLERQRGKILVDYITTAGSDNWQDFASGTLGSNGWTGVGTTLPVDFDLVSAELKCNATADGDSINASYIKKTYGRNIAFGYWEFQIRSHSSETSADIHFFTSGDANELYGYYLVCKTTGWEFWKFTDADLIPGSGNGRYEQIDYGSTAFLDTSNKTIGIARLPDGTFKLYVGGVFVKDVFDDEHNYSQFFAFKGDSIFIDNIYIPSSTITSTYQSATIDTITTPSAWGNLSVDYSGISTVTLKTRVSSDDSSWDALVAVTSTNGIDSAVKRYIQVQITISTLTDTLPLSYGEFFVDSYTVQFTTTRVFIAMGNFSGLTCYNAIQELAKFSDFEWGLDDDEQFFFRARTTSATPDETFTQAINIREISFLHPGYDNTYSIVQARFGNFVSETSSAADSRTSALEIYGRKFFNISSSMLINKDTNVASAIASTYHTRLSSKKRRLRMSTKFWPQIELSDTLSVTYKRDAFDTTLEPFLSALICKVIGTRHDAEMAQSEFELEEIL